MSLPPKEKAEQLYHIIHDSIPCYPDDGQKEHTAAKLISKILAEELLKRDIQWIEKLSKEYPADWSYSDIEKSKIIFDQVKEEIDNIKMYHG